jgi:hypothetical protein
MPHEFQTKASIFWPLAVVRSHCREYSNLISPLRTSVYASVRGLGKLSFEPFVRLKVYFAVLCSFLRPKDVLSGKHSAHARFDLSNNYFPLVGNCTFDSLCVKRLEDMDEL